MAKTFEIVDGTITPPQQGVIVKENVLYYEDAVLVNKEIYSRENIVVNEIKEGYTNPNFYESDPKIPTHNESLI